MKNVNVPNLLYIFNDSLDKIIDRLENNNPDGALIRAKETRKTFKKMLNFIGYDEKEVIKDI